MTIDYKRVNGTQVVVICDIENADLTKDEWKKFGNMIFQRFEDMLPTVTIVGVDYHVLRRIIEKRSGDALLAHAICGRLWEMGINKIEYLPASAQPQEKYKPIQKTVEKPTENTAKPKDYCVNGGRGYGSKVVQQLDSEGKVIREFPSAAAAARYYKISYDAIRMCCYGKCKTSGGRLWRYKEV